MTQPIETAALDTPERKVDTLLAHYGLSHTHPVNELIHYIAIPAIMLSLAGLMFAIHPAVVLVFFGASLVYYARLSGPFTICMLLGTSILLSIVDALNQRGLLVGAACGAKTCSSVPCSPVPLFPCSPVPGARVSGGLATVTRVFP